MALRSQLSEKDRLLETLEQVSEVSIKSQLFFNAATSATDELLCLKNSLKNAGTQISMVFFYIK